MYLACLDCKILKKGMCTKQIHMQKDHYSSAVMRVHAPIMGPTPDSYNVEVPESYPAPLACSSIFISDQLFNFILYLSFRTSTQK